MRAIIKEHEEGIELGEDIFRVLIRVTRRVDKDIQLMVEVQE